MNLSLNFSTTTYTEVQNTEIDIIDYMSRYCSKVDNAIFIYIGVYAIAHIIVMLLYKFDKISMEKYADLSNRIQASHVMFSIIMFTYLLLRNGGL